MWSRPDSESVKGRFIKRSEIWIAVGRVESVGEVVERARKSEMYLFGSAWETKVLNRRLSASD